MSVALGMKILATLLTQFGKIAFLAPPRSSGTEDEQRNDAKSY